MWVLGLHAPAASALTQGDITHLLGFPSTGLFFFQLPKLVYKLYERRIVSFPQNASAHDSAHLTVGVLFSLFRCD